MTEKAVSGIGARAKLALVSLVGLLAMSAPVMAMTFDLNGIQVVLANMSGTILPAFLDLVVAALPVIVVISICAFIVGFLDKILNMIKI